MSMSLTFQYETASRCPYNEFSAFKVGFCEPVPTHKSDFEGKDVMHMAEMIPQCAQGFAFLATHIATLLKV